MAAITSAQLLRGTRSIYIDDMIYLPRPPQLKNLHNAVKVLLERVPLEVVCPGFKGEDLDEDPSYALLVIPIEHNYNTFLNANAEREPPWIKHANPSLKKYLRWQRVLTSPKIEQFGIGFELPFSGINYIVTEGGLTHETVNTFGIGRLNNVRQLAYLQDPIVTKNGPMGGSFGFNHTRYCHSLDVIAVATLIAYNLGLCEKQTNTLRIAAITHDALTPAGGDTTKFADRHAFDEDAHYPELLEGRDWSNIKAKYTISESMLIDTVQGKGILGKILDIADKVSYVSRDAYIYLMRYRPYGPRAYPQGFAQIKAIFQLQRNATGIWDALKLHGDDIVITDPERLGIFLKLRALMFRELYCGPGSRWLETVLAHIIIKYLYDTGKLTREHLIRINDYELDRLIAKFTGCDLSFLGGLESFNPRVEVFDSTERAQARERELIFNGQPLTLIEDLTGIVKPATGYLVESNSRIAPFRDMFPCIASNIEKIAKLDPPVRLYYCDTLPEFNQDFLAHIQEYQNAKIMQ